MSLKDSKIILKNGKHEITSEQEIELTKFCQIVYSKKKKMGVNVFLTNLQFLF